MTDLEAIEIIESVEDVDDNVTIEAWQTLVDSGVVWELQGHYGRTATALIVAKLIHLKDSKYDTRIQD